MLFDLGICLVLRQPAHSGGDAHANVYWAGKNFAAVRNVVCRDAVRHRPAAQLPSRLYPVGLVDRPSCCVLGAGCVGGGDEPVHRGLGPGSGLKRAEKVAC